MELAAGTSVMAIGGFSGSDAYPTLDRFQAYVHDGQIRYFVSGRGPGGPGGDRGVGQQITEWVAAQGLTPHPAQEEALLDLVTGDNVVLATPTGSGKSLVATGAHFFALAAGERLAA